MILVKPSYKILSEINREEILKRIELAGRTCYKSEDKITEDSASKFVKMIIKSSHLSVIEHISISVKFICDRGISHELVRHRLASYSQESSRYCCYSDQVTFIVPLWCKNIESGEYSLYNVSEFYGLYLNSDEFLWYHHMLDSENRYLELLKQGWKPQQARSVLPNSLKTEIVVTANLREWLHIFNLRCSEKAHPQIRELMIPLREELKSILPEIFKGE